MADLIRRQLEGIAALLLFPASLPRRLEQAAHTVGDIRDQLRALPDLPGEIEQNVRTTNELIKVSRAQLAVLQKQTELVIEAMDIMRATAERVQLITDPLLETARQATEGVRAAGERAVQAREEVARTNELLGRVLSLAEPLERAQRQGFDLLFGRREE